MAKFEFNITAGYHDQRLDKFLFSQILAVSKMHLRDLIAGGKCLVNGEVKPPGYHLCEADRVVIEVDTEAETAMKPENIPLEVIFEDRSIIVVNKPAGMLVHPTFHQRSGTLLNALAFYLNFDRQKKETAGNVQPAAPMSGPVRPGLIHRLDRQTSGLMVIAKDPAAHRKLSEHFRRKLVAKKYLALVEGVVAAGEGTIDAPIGRFEETKIWNVKPDGKPAQSVFKVLKRSADTTLLELEPVTGRTNQLRIHCAHLGHPIVGDTERGGRAAERLYLHAHQLEFWHPGENVRVSFTAEPPAELN